MKLSITNQKLLNLELLALSALVFTLLSPCFAGVKGDSKRGQKVFSAMTCDICHVNGGNNLNPERPIKGAAFVKRFPDDVSLTALIRKGIESKGMPAFGRDKMSDQDMADVLCYVRSLTPDAKASKPLKEPKSAATAKINKNTKATPKKG